MAWGRLPWLRASAACNEAGISREDGRFSVVGDPTEGALLVAAAKGGLVLEDIDARMPRLFTIPFSSERKLMTMVRNVDGRPRAFVKGAPEVVLRRCSWMRSDGGVAGLAGSERASAGVVERILNFQIARCLSKTPNPPRRTRPNSTSVATAPRLPARALCCENSVRSQF